MRSFDQDRLGTNIGKAALKKARRVSAGKHGESLEPIPVPPEYLVVEGSPRDPTQGVPSAVFRYDIIYELTSAIVRAKNKKKRRTFLSQLLARHVLSS